jgi:peptide deformylase
MALLEILTVPDPRVRETALPVEKVDRGVRRFMDNMADTLFHVDGVGLAAIQVGEKKRVIVVDRSADGKSAPAPLFMANPEILWMSPATQIKTEGCYSVPGYYEEVERPLELKVSYLDENDQPQLLMAKDLLAHCIHHEIEHLDGVLFVDHLSSLKRRLILRRVIKKKTSRK